MDEHHFDNSHDRHSQNHADDAGKLPARQQSKHNDNRMHMQAFADDKGPEDIAFNKLKKSKIVMITTKTSLVDKAAATMTAGIAPMTGPKYGMTFCRADDKAEDQRIGQVKKPK